METTKDKIIRKLTSRKFWAALGAVALAVMAIFGVDDLTTQQVIALIGAIGTLIAYIVGEGIVDAKGATPPDADELGEITVKYKDK